MLKLTIQLFLKALVIGVVVSLTLLYAAEPSGSAGRDTMSQFEHQSLEHSSANPDLPGEFDN